MSGHQENESNAMETDNGHIFVSYSHHDERAVSRMVERLVASGLRVWRDVFRDPAGDGLASSN